jgi:transketolase
LYACLARRGYFSREELWSYGRLGATLQGFADIRTPGVDAPWCYGGGIGIACGIALSFGSEGQQRVFCLVDESDMVSGAAWESIVALPPEGAKRLVLLIDSTTPNEKTASGLEAFGWDVVNADGSDFDSMNEAFGALNYNVASPKAIIVRNETVDMADLGFQGEDAPMSMDDVDNAITLLDNATRGNRSTDGGI